LIRFGGHFPKGGYDVQNGIKQSRKAGAATVHGEFMAGAVRLVLDEGKTIGAVSGDLDLTPSSLANWVRHAQADRTRGKTGLTTEERTELSTLRRENRELRMERDILKNVGSAPPLQGWGSSDGEAVCVNVSGLLVAPAAPGLDGIRAHRSS
jgi:transposase